MSWTMTAELIAAFLRANVAAGAATLLALALRGPMRRRFGAQTAYLLWAVVPAAAAASLLPARVIMVSAAAAPGPLGRLALALPGGAVAGLWLAGALVAMAAMAWGQIAFLRRAAAGAAGPAMVGVVAPRLVTPSDYHARFTAEERELVRAHERVHVERGDPKINALTAAAQCLNWFNPLIHVAVHFMRLDQELACDAVVVARRPAERRRYAETLLKTQLGDLVLPFGCQWPARRMHPFEARLTQLALPRATPVQLRRGAGLVALAGLAAGVAVWAARPVETVGPPAERPLTLYLDIIPPAAHAHKR